jgi:hypothetical protein
MTQEQFSRVAHEPVATTFHGFRAFMIDDGADPSKYGHTSEAGLLRSVYMTHHAWAPGVNVARCHSTGMGKNLPLHGGATEGQTPKAMQDCMCGFWAYTGGQHYLTVPGHAAFGVIEAWGRMVIGPAGFRAEKGRIVAVCVPEAEKGWDAVGPTVEPLSVGESLGRVVWSFGAAMRPAGEAMSRALRALATGKRAPAPATPAPAPEPPQPTQHRTHEVPRDLVLAVRARYGVPVFTSIGDMQREYPVSDLSALLTPDGEGS